MLIRFEKVAEAEHEYHEAIIRSLCSDRLFFDPSETSSILKRKEFENTFELLLDSQNPCEDFRKSIVEMVEA